MANAFSCCLRQLEAELKEKADDAYHQYAVEAHLESRVLKQVARFFVNFKEWSDNSVMGDARKEIFSTIISQDELQNKVVDSEESPLTKIDFMWKTIDKIFHRYQLQLRPLMMTLDFSSTETGNRWLTAITWLKQIFTAQENLEQYSASDCPTGTLPKRLHRYLLKKSADGKQKLRGYRYEFWMYRRLKKWLRTGELYLADSIHHRSLQQELAIAHEANVLTQQMDVPALNKPIAHLLDERISELNCLWQEFNRDFSQEKLKHLRYDEKTKILHLTKTRKDHPVPGFVLKWGINKIIVNLSLILTGK